MPNTKWFLKSIDYELTGTGYKITITTDVPVHLWMRWTTVEPKEHLVPVIRRGVAFRSDKYFCFDVYEDNEQNQAGDTLSHIFIKPNWDACTTRYFYFHGEIAGTPSPSTTTIFSKHRVAPPPEPETEIFYSDPHPEADSFDGLVGHNENLLWADLRLAAGNVKGDTAITILIGFQSSGNAGKYNVMRRGIHLFDTTDIQAGSTIQAATLKVWGTAKLDTFPIAPGLVVVKSNPISDVEINFGDFQTMEAIALSDVIEYADFTVGALNTMTLNAAGLNAIVPAGITKLGTREGNYEQPNNPPLWAAGRFALLQYNSVEKGGGFRPQLEVTWIPP